MLIVIVPVDVARLAIEQSGLVTSVHPHGQGCSDRSQPECPNPEDVQAILRSHGYVCLPSSGLVRLLHDQTLMNWCSSTTP